MMLETNSPANGDAKAVLDLCGGTGAWSKPYSDAGYDVRVITLPEYDVEYVAMNKDGVLFFKASGGFTAIRYDKISGILAAPPCTEFSIAKGARSRDLAGAMKTVKACTEIIWAAQQNASLDFWALENPRGLLRRFLGIPKYTFEQWQFGGNKRKPTDIWGYFNIPTPTVKEFPKDLVKNDGRERAHAADWMKCEYPPEYEAYMCQFKGDAKRAAARAVTPKGFAEAFYRANKPKC